MVSLSSHVLVKPSITPTEIPISKNISAPVFIVPHMANRDFERTEANTNVSSVPSCLLVVRMFSLREQIRPTKATTDQVWRKRPAQQVATTAQMSAKRFKSNSSLSSSHTTGQDARRPRIPPTRSSPDLSVKAEQWFDETNEHPMEVSFFDNDPPYFMKNEPPEYDSVCATQSGNSSRDISQIGPTAPTRSLLAQMNGDNDDGKAYRSVIDDLTIQNKKLKKKLKKYQTLHCSHLQEEKLFEIRVHGLPANRKRELEDTLRTFASSINEDSPCSFYPQIPETAASVLRKSSSSATSPSKLHGDSAYASMSGRVAITPLAHLVEQPQNQQASRQTIKSYLYGIPANLAPEPPVAMSDRAKSKAIVRRLEQIFTGRGAGSHQYGQSQQQQEVSRSAALASNQSLDHEGTREAHMLALDAELQVDAIGDAKTQASGVVSNQRSRQVSVNGSPRSPEQRPTRPLDLDLHRAQIPSDNIEYIRHLDVSSTVDDTVDSPESKDGWMWLNLLTSMAQLHTLNATPEFIRTAVANFSSKFELSPDKTKIRWLGGCTGTMMSSDGDDSEDQMLRKPPSKLATDEALDLTSAQTHVSIDPSTIPETGAMRRPLDLNDGTDGANSFQYKPLFFHTATSDEDESDAGSELESSDGSPGSATGINSGTSALHGITCRAGGQRRNDGPMIFYSGALFCTDLSGDVNGIRRKRSSYRLATEKPVGSFDLHADERSESENDHIRYAESHPSGSQNEAASSVGDALNLDDLRSSISSYASDHVSQKDMMDMEASGLGGIHPEDNFVVKVRVRHGPKKGTNRKLSSFTKPKTSVRKILHNIPRSSIEAFHSTNHRPEQSQITNPSVKGEIISAVKTELPPSALPPASYLHLPFSSSGSDSDVEDDHEISKNLMTTNCTLAPGQKSTHHHASNSSQSSSTIDSGSESDDDDSSIDLLAHARGLEPETIAAREREYESDDSAVVGVVTGEVGIGTGDGDREQSDVDSMSVDGEGSDG